LVYSVIVENPCFPHRQCTSIDIQFLLPFLLY